MVFIVAMDCPHSKVIDAALLEQTFTQKIHITILLYLIIVLVILHLKANPLNIHPDPLNIQRLVKRELLVHHPNRVIGPHVVPAAVS